VKKETVCFILILVMLLSSGNNVLADQKRDHVKAFFMSLFIPGFGQYYAGTPRYAKVFIAVELAIWGCYYYNTAMKHDSRQDYFSQAALYAGVNPSGFGAPYLNAIGAYNSSYDYNIKRLQSSSNPVLYSGEQTWEWDTEGHRIQFRNLRERELDYENNLKYCIAGIVLNHFLSALNASKLVQKQNRYDSAVTLNVLNEGIIATYSRSF